jgi:fructose 1,6-bisphosphate aldolase/phosphatase
MRRQGFLGAAMLPMTEMEYTGIAETLAALEGRSRIRGSESRT